MLLRARTLCALQHGASGSAEPISTRLQIAPDNGLIEIFNVRQETNS